MLDNEIDVVLARGKIGIHALMQGYDLDFLSRLCLDLSYNLDQNLALSIVLASVRASALNRPPTLANVNVLVNAMAILQPNAVAKSYDFTMKLGNHWKADAYIADLRSLDAPPMGKELDFGLWLLWLERFVEILEPYRNLWDPYKQMTVY